MLFSVISYSSERVIHFGYPGTIVTNNNDMDIEINNRLSEENRFYHVIKNYLKSHLISLNTKLLSVKHQYYNKFKGIELWLLNKSDENKLLIPERKIHRKIFVTLNKSSIRKSDYIYEIYKKYTW